MKTRIFKAVFFSGLLVAFFSCKKDDPITPLPDADDGVGYSKGTFVVCEGAFNTNSGTIMYMNDTVSISDVFAKVNNRPLGDVVQSMHAYDTIAYIVVNNSQKIEVVNLVTFQSIATIRNVSFPQHVIQVQNNVFVTNGNGNADNYVYVFNTTNYDKIDSIPTEAGPNQILYLQDRLFVANTGGWTNDSTITVINPHSFSVDTVLNVGDMPLGCTVDKDNNLLVLCKGLTTYDEQWNPTVKSNSKIVLINTETFELTTLKDFSHQIEIFATNLMSYYNGIAYYIDNDGVYSLRTDTHEATKIISGNFYAISIEPKTGNIWLCNTSSLTQHTLEVYSSLGDKIKEHNVEDYPNAVLFLTE